MAVPARYWFAAVLLGAALLFGAGQAHAEPTPVTVDEGVGISVEITPLGTAPATAPATPGSTAPADPPGGNSQENSGSLPETGFGAAAALGGTLALSAGLVVYLVARRRRA